jgi:hypothetical protein
VSHARWEIYTSTIAALESVPRRNGPANGRNQREKKKIRKAQPDTRNHTMNSVCKQLNNFDQCTSRATKLGARRTSGNETIKCTILKLSLLMHAALANCPNTRWNQEVTYYNTLAKRCFEKSIELFPILHHPNPQKHQSAILEFSKTPSKQLQE